MNNLVVGLYLFHRCLSFLTLEPRAWNAWVPPDERSGRCTYANALWHDKQGKEWRWYEIRPDVDRFVIVELHNHAQSEVTGAGNFRTRQAAQEWMEKTIAP